MAEEYNEEYNEEYHEEYQEDPGEPVEPEEPVEQEYDPSLDVEANETNEPSYGQGNEEQVEEGNTGNSEYDEGGVDVLETNNEDLGNTEEPLVAETTDNVDSYENESGSPDIAKGTPVDGNADFDEVPAVTEKTDGDSDDSDDDDDSKDEQLPGPTNEEQKKFLLSVLYKKVKGIKLNWKNAGDDEPWDYVEFDEEGMITSLLLPKSGIDLDFKHMAPLFSEFLQVVDLSSNKLKGFITDAFNVEIKGLISFNVSGNKKLKGDVCEDIGKSKKLTEFSVARTKLFGNISDLADCKELTIINVGNTEVSGKLKDLEEMVQLTHVCCDFSQVTGDIISASKWPELKVIYLNGKQIVGDLSVFRKHCRKLNEIWLTKSNVLGDLTSVSKCKELTLLDIYGTQVGGEITVLKECPMLQSLYLSYCFVTGDIACLKENPELTHILLDYTYVTGDISVFSSNDKVQEIGLAYTQCVGSLASFEECVHLKFLNVYGIRGFDENPDPKGPKPIKLLKKNLYKNKKVQKLKHTTKITI